jgi:Cu-processing system ATP-binding protein
MIRFTGLAKRFGSNVVLDGVEVDFHSGRVTGVVGPNGAGKTTLIKIVLGLARADAGLVTIDGHAVGPDPSYRATLGYMPQIARFPENLTIGEVIALVADVRGGAARDEELIDRFQLRELYAKPLGTLSGGTRQKVNAALAFLFAPAVLILDEPTAGLDPASSAVLKDKIALERDRGRTVIVTSHIMAELEELCDDVVFLLEGRIRFAGPVRELMTRTRQTTLERAVATMMIREVA